MIPEPQSQVFAFPLSGPVRLPLRPQPERNGPAHEPRMPPFAPLNSMSQNRPMPFPLPVSTKLPYHYIYLHPLRFEKNCPASSICILCFTRTSATHPHMNPGCPHLPLSLTCLNTAPCHSRCR